MPVAEKQGFRMFFKDCADENCHNLLNISILPPPMCGSGKALILK